VVEEAIHKLHPSVQEYLANVAIILEDLPTDEVLAGYDPPASPTGLLGYFSGYSLSERSVETPWSNLPSAIVIYRRNIERLSSSREELVEQVGLTVFHEVGHLLGLDFELTQGAKE
jgi:predicted Zn-dependent protease with MMP-like domain